MHTRAKPGYFFLNDVKTHYTDPSLIRRNLLFYLQGGGVVKACSRIFDHYDGGPYDGSPDM